MSDGLSNIVVLASQEIRQGRKEFEFELADDFFTQIQGSEITGGSVYIEIDVLSIDDYLQVKIHIDGTVQLSCDRCLDDVALLVENDDELTIQWGLAPSEASSMETDIMFVLPTTEWIDLTQYCYENIYLSLPIQRIHPDDENGVSTCNPKMLQYLTLDSKIDETGDSEPMQTPFDILKTLSTKKNTN